MTTTTQTAATATTPPAFIGWYRPNRSVRWTRLTDGPDYGTTLCRLIEALASVRGGDSLVSRASADPNTPPRRYVAGGRRQL